MKYQKQEVKKGINLHLINSEKFKTNLIAIFLSTPLTREDVTYNAVLSATLRRGTQNIKSQEELSAKLEEMYGADFDNGLEKLGDNHILKFYLESINDEFLPQNDEEMLKKSINILSEIVFNPLIENNAFNEEYVMQEKENIRQIIEGKKDNKAKYAMFRCVEEMYKGEPAGLYKFGYSEDLENINAQNLYEYYKKLIKNCKIDIFVSGNIEKIDIKEILLSNEQIHKLEERNPVYNKNKISDINKQIKEKEEVVEEELDVTQGKLVIGYDINLNDDMKNDDKFRYQGMLYNAILGGTANSKLFQNVREKSSLAYTASSTYSYYKSNIFVNCGIEIDNFQKAVDIIKEQIQDMKLGNFTNEDLENAKKIIISNIISIDDEQDTEIMYFFGQELNDNNVSLKQYEENVKSVDFDQVKRVAENVNINTIYFLRSRK